MNYLGMFAASFFAVFLLGLQSKNVNQSRYLAAGATSIGIAIAQFAFAKYAAHGGALELAIMCVAGVTGITCSIWVHDHWIKRSYRWMNKRDSA